MKRQETFWAASVKIYKALKIKTNQYIDVVKQNGAEADHNTYVKLIYDLKIIKTRADTMNY